MILTVHLFRSQLQQIVEPIFQFIQPPLNIRQLVDTVKVVSAEEIVVYLQGGIEVTQEITG